MKYVAVFVLVIAALSLCFHIQFYPQKNGPVDLEFLFIYFGFAIAVLFCAPISAVAFQSNRKKTEIIAGAAIFVFFLAIMVLSAYKIIHIH
jgi:hypothetical protein